MSTIKAAILGFGTVGQGIYHILNEKRDELKRTLGFELEVVAILIHDQNKARPVTPNVFVTDCYEEILSILDVQIVFEAIIGEEPAYTYLSKAIDKGCHVITANKMMFSKYGSKLMKKAEAKGLRIGFEATTAGGIPIIKTLKNLLVVNDVTRILGILNGTSNYILTQMRKENYSFEEALLEAQLLGYAEADPYQDISGQDAFRKLMILSELSFGKQPSWNDVEVIGIENIVKEDVVEAEKAGLRYRHIAEVRMNENGLIQAKVSPVLVGISHPLFTIEGVNNAVVVDTSYIGTLSLIGPGAGRFPTASAMVEDYVNIVGQHVKQHAIQ